MIYSLQVLALVLLVLSCASDAFHMPSARFARSFNLQMKAFPNMPESVKPGVVTGKALVDLLDYAKAKKFAIPGVNIVGTLYHQGFSYLDFSNYFLTFFFCVGTNSINACMEAASKYKGPIMVTFSKGSGQFIAGKGADNTNEKASIAGAIAGAKHVREVAKLYGVPVILHTDHCQKSWLPCKSALITLLFNLNSFF